jgi:chemotaxis protein methyltransferase CheR
VKTPIPFLARNDRVMNSRESCVAFLQWALPRLGLAWPGFRRVHRQVCKRIGRRLQALGLSGTGEYHMYLESHPDEWATLDSFCRISISRLVRDRAVFEVLTQLVLPHLAALALARGARELRCWSAGCASGEEPYSLSMLWKLELAHRFPDLALTIVATDIDEALLARARIARYTTSSLREVPAPWIDAAFTRSGRWFTLRPEFRTGVELRREDIRDRVPAGPFDMILCRNLVFTYFDASLQRRTLEKMLDVLRPGGALVIGFKERLPGDVTDLVPFVERLGIYRTIAGGVPPQGG